MTKRFAESVARLAQVLPIKRVAKWFGLSRDTAQAINQAALESRLGPVDLSRVHRNVIDEFAIQNGYRWAAVIAKPETRRVLRVGRGRSQEDVRPFFEALGPEGAAAVGISQVSEAETRAHCPQARIVYDLFHGAAKFDREVIDRVRVDETNRVKRATGPGAARDRRRVINGARWLLPRNATTLTTRRAAPAPGLLAANRQLWMVYVLKDALKQLRRYKYCGAAERA